MLYFCANARLREPRVSALLYRAKRKARNRLVPRLSISEP